MTLRQTILKLCVSRSHAGEVLMMVTAKKLLLWQSSAKPWISCIGLTRMPSASDCVFTDDARLRPRCNSACAHHQQSRNRSGHRAGGAAIAGSESGGNQCLHHRADLVSGSLGAARGWLAPGAVWCARTGAVRGGGVRSAVLLGESADA